MTTTQGSCPLQIISIESVDGCHGFYLNEDNLNLIIDKIPLGKKVGLMSMVGAFRTGKSFMLNLFLRYLRHGKPDDLSESWITFEGESILEGNSNEWVREQKSVEAVSESTTESTDKQDMKQESFKWRGGQERQTTGVWMWSEPFLRKVEGCDEEMAILLMDTQGMFDNETTMTLTAQIFGLSTLVSSYQIYNVDKRIQEDNLQHLALFSEYGRMGLQRDTEVADDAAAVGEGEGAGEAVGDAKDAPPTPAPSASATRTEKEPFQRLDFLVRDWQNFRVDLDEGLGATEAEADLNYGRLRAEMDEYLEKVISTNSRAHLEDLVGTREQISRCFERVGCHLLPHPGSAVTKLNFKGEIKKIEPAFLSLVNRYVRKVFDEDIRPKRVNDREITAPELRGFFRAYVALFQDDKQGFPKAMTMLEATSEANNRNALELAELTFSEGMNEVVGKSKAYVKDAVLEATRRVKLEEALALFDRVATMGSPAAIKSYRDKFLAEVEKKFEVLRELNSSRNPFRDVELYAIPLLVAAVSWLLSVLVDKTCSTDVCERAEDGLERVYMFTLFALVVFAWRYIRGAYQHLRRLLPLLLSQAGGDGEAVFGVKEKAS